MKSVFFSRTKRGLASGDRRTTTFGQNDEHSYKSRVDFYPVSCLRRGGACANGSSRLAFADAGHVEGVVSDSVARRVALFVEARDGSCGEVGEGRRQGPARAPAGEGWGRHNPAPRRAARD